MEGIGDLEEQEELRRRQFEREYLAWLKFSAREIAESLRRLSAERREEIFAFYEMVLREPEKMHSPLSSDERKRLERLLGGGASADAGAVAGVAGVAEVDAAEAVVERASMRGAGRLRSIVLLKTPAVVFAHAIFPTSSFFDVGVAMHRRFFVGGRWFAVISLNASYLEIASDAMLRYLLEHELIQGEMYEELARMNVRHLSPELKGAYHEAARLEAIRRTRISEEEVRSEEEIIRELSLKEPLVPTGFAASSIYLHLLRNYEALKHFGWESRDDMEREWERLSHEFASWIDFSVHSFGVFVSELKRLVRSAGEFSVEFV
ncbi:MAG: hypothetical protein N2V73_01070 [Candidatus Methanospirare jalkutatii]|nr:hypothetical protein [Candidatus Methanospirare jalkutatii]MCW7080331.1 hypothetical protein [Candidatus Methanospirare jalkutatii]